jgi:hypothetical protein
MALERTRVGTVSFASVQIRRSRRPSAFLGGQLLYRMAYQSGSWRVVLGIEGEIRVPGQAWQDTCTRWKTYWNNGPVYPKEDSGLSSQRKTVVSSFAAEGRLCEGSHNNALIGCGGNASEILVGHVLLCYTHGNYQNQDEIHPVNSN